MKASLRRSAYCDASVFGEEQRVAMATSWVCIGRRDSVGAEPGSYRLAAVAGEQVLVVRGADSALAAFANRCMHRDTELVDSVHGVALACFDSVIRCPCHFWTYEFDGSLRSSPLVDDIDRTEFSLHRYGLSEWGGFVFVRLADHGPGLVDDLGPIAHRLLRFPLADLVVGQSLAYDVAANWKVIAENYNECYHCGPVHPELCELVRWSLRGRCGWRGVGPDVPRVEGWHRYGVAARRWVRARCARAHQLRCFGTAVRQRFAGRPALRRARAVWRA